MPVLRGKLKPEDQVKITRNYNYLVSELDGDHLACRLLEGDVFNIEDMEDITSQATTEKKNKRFLWNLLHSGPFQAYDVFLRALKKEYPHVAEKLEQTPQEEGASNAEETTLQMIQELNIESSTSRTTDNAENGSRDLLTSSTITAYQMTNADILLVGKIGVGKSSLGNMILQKKAFMSGNARESVTKDIQYDYSEFEGTVIKIVDGPGVEDIMRDKEKALSLVVDAMTRAVMSSLDGFHAILIVVRYGGQLTEDDFNAIKVLKVIFGEAFVSNHGILVMTCGDLFAIDAEDNNDQTFEHWCQRQGGRIGEHFKEVQNRVILFNNKAKGEAAFEQIRRLLHMIKSLCSNGSRYTSEIFMEAKLKRDRLILEAKRSLLQEKKHP